MKEIAALTSALAQDQRKSYTALTDSIGRAIQMVLDRVAFDLGKLGTPNVPRCAPARDAPNHGAQPRLTTGPAGPSAAAAVLPQL